MKTLRDLYDYLQIATRDYYGYHTTNEGFKMHIYNSKREANFIFEDKVIGKIMFDPEYDEAQIVKVDNKQYADYDNTIRVSIDSNIETLINKVPPFMYRAIITAIV